MVAQAIDVARAIGVSAWTFHERFRAGTMDYPRFFAAARGAGLRLVELNSPFFKSQDGSYITSIKRAADDYGITIVNIAVDDFAYDLSATDEANRREAVDRTIAWLDIAVALDCPSVRNNTGGDNLAQCTTSFFALAAAAKERGRRIAIEAHGGFSADADQIVPLVRDIRRAYPDQIGLIPDFGNVTPTPAHDRYQQVAAMAPYAFLVHPKMEDFDERGEQPGWDTARLVDIVRREHRGFTGPWIIEFEGKEDAFSGLHASIALLSRCLES